MISHVVHHCLFVCYEFTNLDQDVAQVLVHLVKGLSHGVILTDVSKVILHEVFEALTFVFKLSNQVLGILEIIRVDLIFVS